MSIAPDPAHPRYWCLGGGPVLLLGGSSDHNLFQTPPEDLAPELDALAAAGGNLVRNTMSDRGPGNLRAFHREADGRYDLGRWNDAYWRRFSEFLRLTSERGIVVQIELWDRFDHSREEWLPARRPGGRTGRISSAAAPPRPGARSPSPRCGTPGICAMPCTVAPATAPTGTISWSFPRIPRRPANPRSRLLLLPRSVPSSRSGGGP